MHLQFLLFAFSGIGYATQVIEAHLNVYYVVILAWAIFYLFNCFTTELPWAGCGHYWNTGRWREHWIRLGNLLTTTNHHINTCSFSWIANRKQKIIIDHQCDMCTNACSMVKVTCCVSIENCVDYYGENATNITNPNATSPVIEFWEWVHLLFLLFFLLHLYVLSHLLFFIYLVAFISVGIKYSWTCHLITPWADA